MNELQTYFPNSNLKTLAEDFPIETRDDFARRLLFGGGKSPNTTTTYLTGCKQFCEFTGGLHPIQAGTPEWIEAWYDSLLKNEADLNTATLRIKALKFMYRKVRENCPVHTSPFNIMCEELKAKLNRSKRDEAERDALTEREYKSLLKMLAQDTTLKGYQNYAMIRFGVISGMRAAELVALRWENIQKTEEGYSATFIGKGSKVRTIQLETASVAAVRKAYRERWSRQPQPTDLVFHATAIGGSVAGITKPAVHGRIKAVIQVAKQLGIVRANLNVSTHTMRHTCATRLLAAGVDIYTVSRHLGHSNVSTTDRYLHTKADIFAAFEKMSGEAAA